MNISVNKDELDQMIHQAVEDALVKLLTEKKEYLMDILSDSSETEDADLVDAIETGKTGRIKTAAEFKSILH